MNGKELASAAPYLTGELVKGQKLTLLRNETYAGPRPVFEKVELIQKTPEEAAAALLSKELDVISTLTPDSYELLKGKPGVRIFEQPGEQLQVRAGGFRPCVGHSGHERSSVIGPDAGRGN